MSPSKSHATSLCQEIYRVKVTPEDVGHEKICLMGSIEGNKSSRTESAEWAWGGM